MQHFNGFSKDATSTRRDFNNFNWFKLNGLRENRILIVIQSATS